MRFTYSQKLNTVFKEVAKQFPETLLCDIPNDLIEYCVIPTDDQHVWFEEGAAWAKNMPQGSTFHRVYYDGCVYYMQGSENICLDRLNEYKKKLKNRS